MFDRNYNVDLSKSGFKRIPIKNKFNGGFDTLLAFSASDAELIFYQNPEKVVFYKANIFSKDPIWRGSSHFSRESFFRALTKGSTLFNEI